MDQRTDAEIEARRQAVVALVKHEDGVLELDTDARISEGDENGAYVQCWVWVDFAGTPLDKEPA